MAFVQLEPCPFPKVLLRSGAFHALPDALACARALKRWVFDQRPPARRATIPQSDAAQVSSELWIQLADRPATIEWPHLDEAHAFAAQAHDELKSVFRVDCRDSSLAEITGELGVQMGLHVPGTARSNLDAVRDVCARYRCLLVMEGPNEDAAEEFREFGRSSVLIVRPAPDLPPPTLEAASGQLRSLTGWVKNPAAPVPQSRDVRRTVEWLITTDWEKAQPLAGAAVAYYKHHDRLAEAFELTDILLRAAVRRQSAPVANDAARERQWLLEAWGLNPALDSPLAPTGPAARQLSFSF